MYQSTLLVGYLKTCVFALASAVKTMASLEWTGPNHGVGESNLRASVCYSDSEFVSFSAERNAAPILPFGKCHYSL